MDRECIEDILALLVQIRDHSSESFDEVKKGMDAFHSRWRVHLNRSYFQNYEEIRWEFLSRYVLGNTTLSTKPGNCLDLGCGRGAQTRNLISNRYALSAKGIDATDFAAEWRDRQADVNSDALSFEHIPIDFIGSWSRSQGKYDHILLCYVLHHSSEYWVIQTLEVLKRLLSPQGTIIILEDAYSAVDPPEEDVDGLSAQWLSLASPRNPYELSPAYHIQMVLDFVAVRLLAGFTDVEMPFNYKSCESWKDLFGNLGFRVERSSYIGFPSQRDIDVPQAYFCLVNE